MFSANEILDMAIQLEKNGEAIYRDTATMISDEELVSLLKWMADEEVKHADWFAEQKQKSDSFEDSSIEQEMGTHILNSLLSQQNFSLGDIDFSTVTEVDRLIELFIEFEKDTILFYEMLEPFVKNAPARTRLKEIISEEHKHVNQLEGFLKD